MKNKNESASQENHPRQYHPDALLRLSEVLELISISKSSWYAGLKSGRFPKPMEVGPRTKRYRHRDIKAICDEGVANG